MESIFEKEADLGLQRIFEEAESADSTGSSSSSAANTTGNGSEQFGKVTETMVGGRKVTVVSIDLSNMRNA
jgi:hypothetical protein